MKSSRSSSKIVVPVQGFLHGYHKHARYRAILPLCISIMSYHKIFSESLGCSKGFEVCDSPLLLRLLTGKKWPIKKKYKKREGL